MSQKCFDSGDIETIEGSFPNYQFPYLCNCAELKLHFMILEKAGKKKELLEVLNGKYGSMMKIQLEREKMKMSVQRDLELWDQLLETARETLIEKYYFLILIALLSLKFR